MNFTEIFNYSDLITRGDGNLVDFKNMSLAQWILNIIKQFAIL